MTLQQFSEIFALLAVQLRFTDADEVSIRGYFKALSDIEPELIALAAQRFALGASITDGQAWFPKAPEWRAMAAKVAKDRRDELDVILRRRRLAGEELCRACDDTGWAKADGGGVERCACQDTRHLEVLGRRPMPSLPEYTPDGEPGQLAKVESMAARHVKGMR